ncbi:MAG: site-specific integrase [Bacillota bacterium]|nr:site-specific integrase [Bacillota bacterium]
MAILKRQVRNKRNADGDLTSRAGFVYDVNIKYQTMEGRKTYNKKGFLTREEAQKHESEMRLKLLKPGYIPKSIKESKRTLSNYLLEWLEQYARNNVRPNTYRGYEVNIRKHINPVIGMVPLNEISAPILDNLYREIKKKGFAVNTVKLIHRTLSVALEHAHRYQLIDNNPAKSVLTKFTSNVKTPEPYTVDQIKKLIDGIKDTQWKFIVVLGGLYGLRRNEVLGLRWKDVNISKRFFNIVEQLSNPEIRSSGKMTSDLKEKYSLRALPITEDTIKYFQRQYNRFGLIKNSADFQSIENGFAVCKEDGTPLSEGQLSRGFYKLLETLKLPHIRFHDLRHSAATNMHQITGDFYTIGEILGHSLKGIGNQLGVSGGLQAVTERYIDVRLERKKFVLDRYHKEVHQKKLSERTR